MQGITAEKQVKDFIRMNKKWCFVFASLLLSFALQYCKKANVVDNNAVFFPPVQVRTQLNLNLPQYIFLTQPQGYVYIPEGNKGIVVYHLPQGGYVAYDRTCSYNPTDSCAQLTMDRNYVGLRCGKYANDTTTVFTPCCTSIFELNNGTAIQKPASIPLKSYFTSLDVANNTLFISSSPF
jgi:nitrite reductase/ring-hydroxylating ferredoxin subunit